LLREAKPFLAPAGLLLMEIGQGQVRLIRQLAEEIGGYAPLQVIMDMTGVERVVILQRIG
jgi:methylase of polypeptide subunit release factors